MAANTTEGYGIEADVILKCDLSSVVCDMAHDGIIGQAAYELCGAMFYDEMTKTNRMNYLTIYKGEELKEQARAGMIMYTTYMNDAFMGMRNYLVNNDGNCGCVNCSGVQITSNVQAMAFEAVSERLLELSNKLDSEMPDILASAVMAELMAKHKERIFSDGLDSDGNSLGEYSTKEAYFNKDKFIRKAAFKPLGKPNKSGKRKVNKTMFVAKGYSEFRDIQGRKTDKINLKFTGSLEANLNVLKNGESVLYGTTDADESKKFEGLEKRFDVFGLTKNEKEFLKTEITEAAIVVAKK